MSFSIKSLFLSFVFYGYLQYIRSFYGLVLALLLESWTILNLPLQAVDPEFNLAIEWKVRWSLKLAFFFFPSMKELAVQKQEALCVPFEVCKMTWQNWIGKLYYHVSLEIEPFT